MFALKNYQRNALTKLERFMADAKLMPVADAFERNAPRYDGRVMPYRHYDFGEIPYVCLRLPTGGGKTVLGSHAVRIATHNYLEQDYPVVLWLVPTKTIREQTLEALKQPGHPYRAELDRTFDNQVRVFDIDEVTQIRPQDIGSKCIVVVSTLANLRVNDTSGRRVYAYHEDFEPHFVGVDPQDARMEKVREEDLKENGLGPSSLGKIKFSFANLLALKQPIVIMDEAHNARTKLTFDTLKRIHPRCVIEFTATPDTSITSASNVLAHVSASELKAEEMIKLPIMLTEHDHWQAAVRDAVLTRKKLAIEAQQERDYIRPIVLLQAEPKNGEVTWEALKQHLMDDLHIEEEKIAVATGTQRELEGINLFARDCPIEFIITVEALKEGWDCSFAYVFCSVKEVRSAKDAEQLLGRVLRMPFARRRKVEALNSAYAHLCSGSFSQAAQQLTDKLVDMGFEAMEVPANLQAGPHFDLFADDEPFDLKPQPEPPLTLDLPSKPELPQDGDNKVENIHFIETPEGGVRMEVQGLLNEAVAKTLLHLFSGQEKKAVQTQIEQHNARVEASSAPSERRVDFSPLPSLCILEQGELDLLEPESFLFLNGHWSPLDFPIELSNFSLHETEHTFEVDMDGRQVSYRIAEEKEAYNLNLIDGGFTETDIIRWIDGQIRHSDIPQGEMLAYVSKLIAHLTRERGITLTALERTKHLLVRAIREKLTTLRRQAADKGFQQLLFKDNASLTINFDDCYTFKPGLYPARPPYYRGRYRFRKHYFPVIEDLKSEGEEFECAKAIDAHPQVKHWVRNLVDRPEASFRLPLAYGWFYPDFVAELEDGRLLVVEYKGEVYRTNDDSREKNAIGQLWADKSDGKCLYLMAVVSDDSGRNAHLQLETIIKN